MAYEIWARAQAKWRAIVVFALLQAGMRFVSGLIFTQSPSAPVRLYASLALLATSTFCVVQMWRLLTRDEPGDESWPPLWS